MKCTETIVKMEEGKQIIMAEDEPVNLPDEVVQALATLNKYGVLGMDIYDKDNFKPVRRGKTFTFTTKEGGDLFHHVTLIE